MAVTMKGAFAPLSGEDLAAFEKRHKITLPDEYRSFLLATNGGMPTPDTFPVSGWITDASTVSYFFGIHPGEDYSLDEEIEMYEDRIPKGFLPIGCDSGGNVICLGVRKKYKGKIYLWDHEDELDEDGESKMDMSNLYPLADGMQSFLNTLR